MIHRNVLGNHAIIMQDKFIIYFSPTFIHIMPTSENTNVFGKRGLGKLNRSRPIRYGIERRSTLSVRDYAQPTMYYGGCYSKILFTWKTSCRYIIASLIASDGTTRNVLKQMNHKLHFSVMCVSYSLLSNMSCGIG